MSDWEDMSVRWTVRVALTLYLAALLIRMLGRGRHLRLARLAWTAGYVAFLVHLAVAFHFVHHWSHAAAYEATARQTFETIGLDWGGGIYVNHLFAVIWGLDIVWWWLRPVDYLKRARWLEWTVQGFLAFIAVNATIVFGHGTIRWAGMAAVPVLAVATIWPRQKME